MNTNTYGIGEREIKFRAWTKRWGMVYEHHKEVSIDVHSNSCWKESIDEECVRLMQYTGLKDKNGVEIYEGDIVETVSGKHYWRYLITTAGEQFGGCLFQILFEDNYSEEDENNTHEKRLHDLSKKYREYVSGGKDQEVIGNVFSNPELLNE